MVTVTFLLGLNTTTVWSSLPTHLKNCDVPRIALHGLLKFASFETLLRSDAMQVFVEVQT